MSEFAISVAVIIAKSDQRPSSLGRGDRAFLGRGFSVGLRLTSDSGGDQGIRCLIEGSNRLATAMPSRVALTLLAIARYVMSGRRVQSNVVNMMA